MPEELTLWYDQAYGGPLRITQEEQAPDSWQLSHSAWSAHVVIPLPPSHTEGLIDQLSWEHDKIGAVAPAVMPARDMRDTVLLAARVARGLTLLTQGTAYDIITQQYLNPSDWQDRSLTSFIAADHVLVAVDDQAKPGAVWCYTLGLSKFGYDELEMFIPQGISDRAAKEVLVESVEEVIRSGQSPKVGASFDLPGSDRTLTVAHHRTAAPAGRMLGFRELQES
ncbi:MAG TPA: hypothetical protein VFM24_02335 [Nitrospira sp.]|nr:hypothetical protein [Nitrospira sp.]